MRALLIALALTACTAAPDMPHVHVLTDDSDPALASLVVESVNAWSVLGFVADTTAVYGTECVRGMTAPDAWYRTGMTDCEITMVVQLEAGLPAAGLTDGSSVPAMSLIASQLGEWPMRETIAHEAGHVLLDTLHHAPAGANAIMAPAADNWIPQPADLALACASIGKGC